MQEVYGERKSQFENLTCSCPYIYQPLEIFVDDETKLTLHGLQQHYVKLEEVQKNRKLNDLLDTLEFNQVCLFSVIIFAYSILSGRYLREICCSCNRT